MSRSALQFRITQSGPWQRLLPGVYLGVTGTVTQDQREMAALLYAGQGSMITGVAAVRRNHLRSPGPDVVDVLIPWNCVCPHPSHEANAGAAVCHRQDPLHHSSAGGGGRGLLNGAVR